MILSFRKRTDWRARQKLPPAYVGMTIGAADLSLSNDRGERVAGARTLPELPCDCEPRDDPPGGAA